jgi:hypothetical protein
MSAFRQLIFMPQGFAFLSLPAERQAAFCAPAAAATFCRPFPAVRRHRRCFPIFMLKALFARRFPQRCRWRYVSFIGALFSRRWSAVLPLMLSDACRFSPDVSRLFMPSRAGAARVRAMRSALPLSSASDAPPARLICRLLRCRRYAVFAAAAA